MFLGEKVGLRARVEADVAVLRRELYDDVATFTRASGQAWKPMRPDAPGGAYSLKGADEDGRAVEFSVVGRESGELVGSCGLWVIDQHNRSADLGLGLLPAYRKRGFGLDTVRTLTRYAFDVLGLNRIGLETMAENAAMRATAEKAGFRPEGVKRSAIWVEGAFHDSALYSQLREEWHRD